MKWHYHKIGSKYFVTWFSRRHLGAESISGVTTHFVKKFIIQFFGIMQIIKDAAKNYEKLVSAYPIRYLLYGKRYRYPIALVCFVLTRRYLVTKLNNESSPAFEFTYLILEFQISNFVGNKKKIRRPFCPIIS
jgi:hypothetical protein